MTFHEVSAIAPKHQLKTINPFFTDVWEGRKTFEIRYNDRDFKVGDILWLEEYVNQGSGRGVFKNRVIVARIDYMVTHEDLELALQEGFVCMSITVLERNTINTFC